MADYLLAHDLGTSGNKATLYDSEGNLCASELVSYPTYYPYSGWVEQDPEDWWHAVCAATRALLEKAAVSPHEIAGVSFSGQMMGCVLVDRDGKALRRALIWADTRSTEEERQMLKAAGAERGYRITGHRLSASYGAAKLCWVKNHQPEIYGKAYKMLNAKDYIVGRLTGNFVTDYSDASSTNLFDLEKKTWSIELIEAFGLRADLLPELHVSADIVGSVQPEAARQTGLPEGLPVVIGGGDGACACVGTGGQDILYSRFLLLDFDGQQRPGLRLGNAHLQLGTSGSDALYPLRHHAGGRAVFAVVPQCLLSGGNPSGKGERAKCLSAD